MGYPIQHIVGFDGQTYDIPTGGIKHISFTEKSNDDRTLNITVPSDVNVGDVVVLDSYSSNGGYYWPGTTNQSNITIWTGGNPKYDDSKVVALDASYNYILICINVNSGQYSFELISGGAPAIISYYRGTTGPANSSSNKILHYAGTMGAIPIKEVKLSASQLTFGLNPSNATANVAEAYAYFYACGKYAIIAEVTASASANVKEITVPSVLSTWFRLNAPNFVQHGESSNQYGSYCTKNAAQKSTIDDNQQIELYNGSKRWLIIVGDYAIAKP